MIGCHRLNSLSVKVFAMDAFPYSIKTFQMRTCGSFTDQCRILSWSCK